MAKCSIKSIWVWLTIAEIWEIRNKRSVLIFAELSGNVSWKTYVLNSNSNDKRKMLTVKNKEMVPFWIIWVLGINIDLKKLAADFLGTEVIA